MKLFTFQIVKVLIFLNFLSGVCQSASTEIIRDSTEHILKRLFQCYLHEQQNINGGMDRLINQAVINAISRACAEYLAVSGLSYNDLKE